MIKALLTTIIVFLFNLTIIAQNDTYKIYYYNFSEGSRIEDSEYIMTYKNDIVYLSPEGATTRRFIDYPNNRNVSILKYKNNNYIKFISFDSLPEPVFKDETDTVLGYECKLATYKVFSNNIDVWYTENAAFKGAPYSTYLPSVKAAVLKVVVNGNRVIKADSLVLVDDKSDLTFPVKDAVNLSDAEFEELTILSRYNSINIFNNDTVNFDPDHWEDNPYNKKTQVYHYSKGAVILKKIKVPEEIKQGAFVYAQLECASAGDAYDRTGSVFIVPDDETANVCMLDAFKNGVVDLPEYSDNNGRKYQGFLYNGDYSPPIEIMRFFTSFGAGHFNNKRVINNYPWNEMASYKSEITSVFPVNYDSLWIGLFIGNYDKGGHRVSLKLDVYPSGADSTEIDRHILSLFNTVNIMEMSGQEYGRLFKSDTLEVEFTIDTCKNITLFYTTTGHGGWGGGDEFNPKLNQILLDGKELFSIVPWRTDCATYRLLNPASGNFSNGLSSSDFSRSNWCPGTLTPPYIINIDHLNKGSHIIQVIIDQGDDSGGSFNHWSISGILSYQIINN